MFDNGRRLLWLHSHLIRHSFQAHVSTFQTARNTLSEYMRKDTAFQTPVRNFVDCFAKSSERVWACNSLLETRYNVLKEVHTVRKIHESGARAILKGKHIVTGGDILEKVEHSKKASRGNQRGKRTEPDLLPEMSSSKNDIDQTEQRQPLNREIADCIMVRF